MFRLFRKPSTTPPVARDEERYVPHQPPGVGESVRRHVSGRPGIDPPPCGQSELGLLAPFRFPKSDGHSPAGDVYTFAEFSAALETSSGEQVVDLTDSERVVPAEQIIAITRCCAPHSQVGPYIPTAFVIDDGPRRPRDVTEPEHKAAREALTRILTAWAEDPSVTGVYLGRLSDPVYVPMDSRSGSAK
ncbi:hypothetical protein D6M20_02480 (plasmid) [Rhodococcus qingshengii]|uniref:Uncharacterized protein n=1 Tax=Rhodococcus erythropolis TaxID=1833 RepID=A0A8I0ZZD1_RHOER|nr:hypothetical protein [Rhodococcus erythropolis]QEM25726.1 hypothetical protein D6M20_02480 [Rhodococcus qingshengii]